MDVGYSSILVMWWCSIVIAGLIVGVSYMLGVRSGSIEKWSVYECGFDPFSSGRIAISVSFFVVGLLFMIFDLEVAWLFPWSVVLSGMGVGGLCVVYIFIVILGVGLVYEWVSGGLEWK